MSDNEIGRTPFVEGEVRVYGLGPPTVANLIDSGSQVNNELLPTLYDVRLTTMHGPGMLLKGEERPQGDKGPAYIQEWSVRFDFNPQKLLKYSCKCLFCIGSYSAVWWV